MDDMEYAVVRYRHSHDNIADIVLAVEANELDGAEVLKVDFGYDPNGEADGWGSGYYMDITYRRENNND